MSFQDEVAFRLGPPQVFNIAQASESKLPGGGGVLNNKPSDIFSNNSIKKEK